MKKYLAILAYYIAIITVSSLAGTLLALYMLASLPWMVTPTLMVLIVAITVCLDYWRLNNRSHPSQHNNC